MRRIDAGDMMLLCGLAAICIAVYLLLGFAFTLLLVGVLAVLFALQFDRHTTPKS
jgi:membrane protein implicated in regulation of membrane protease activity